MEFKYSHHANEQIELRGLDKSSIDDVLNYPSKIVSESSDINIYQKIILENNRNFLYRIFVNIRKIPPLVITAYKTSKIEKYEN